MIKKYFRSYFANQSGLVKVVAMSRAKNSAH